jgi:hypothetical protein
MRSRGQNSLFTIESSSHPEKRILNCNSTTVVHPLVLALLLSYILLLKHVQIRQGLQRADALRICPDDLLIVEKDPGAPIVFRTNVRDVVARVDRWTLV